MLFIPWESLEGSFRILEPQGIVQEILDSWKKCVATEFQDPDRIQNKIIKDPDKFTIIFEPGLSQEIDNSWKKRVATVY